MDLKNITRRIATLAERAPQPRRLHAGLVVRFVASDGNGGPAPLPPNAPPHRQPEMRDPARGFDLVLLGPDGVEILEGAR